MGFKNEINLQERAIGVMTTDVFISYSSAYRKLVDALVHYLEESKIKCWYDDGVSFLLPRRDSLNGF